MTEKEFREKLTLALGTDSIVSSHLSVTEDGLFRKASARVVVPGQDSLLTLTQYWTLLDDQDDERLMSFLIMILKGRLKFSD